MPHQRLSLTRRTVVRTAGAALLGAVAARAGSPTPQPAARRSHFPQMPTGFTGVMPCGSFKPPAQIPSEGRIAPPAEPGQPLELWGTIWQPNRRTPAPNVVLFAYHTDAQGHYNAPNSPFNPRLHGWVQSDARGRYQLTTIMPAPYPGRDTPAHIHLSLFAEDLPEYWVDDVWFAGDPLITPHQRSLLTGRGGGGETVTLARQDTGALRGRRDFVLEHVAVSGGCTMLEP